jgi:hypothetical protein
MINNDYKKEVGEEKIDLIKKKLDASNHTIEYDEEDGEIVNDEDYHSNQRPQTNQNLLGKMSEE